MKTKTKLDPTKICTVCGRSLPLIAKYWRLSSASTNGYYSQCKDCCKKLHQEHYRKFTKIDIIERGEVGVKCILWSPKCSVCPCISEYDLSACWRLTNTKLISDKYPIPLAQKA